MYHIAIVEDDSSFAEQLQSYLKLYQEELSCAFKISVFARGLELRGWICHSDGGYQTVSFFHLFAPGERYIYSL